ncbi:anthranilate synthase component II [Flavobacterium sp.]|jgi:anthranilate synthase component 2|uniref:anthranilate synthase component II n=1 Tax=Flavobacterium sp. TaxID=239 RepID=UPI0037BFAA34
MAISVVVIDNYDSFTYNLIHYLEDLGADVTVFRNNEFQLNDLLPFNKILLSPGPGIPEEAGLLKKVIEHYGNSKDILGICLGLQAIGEVYGAKLLNLTNVVHGVSSLISVVNQDIIFEGLPPTIEVGRYHSWVVSQENLPNDLIITSVDENKQIMSLKHTEFNVRGVQFHPESIMTPQGKWMLKNWLLH